MNIKDQLRQLVELLDDDVENLDEAIEYLHWLASKEAEQLSEEEWRRVRKGEAQIARFGCRVAFQFRRMLALGSPL